ncbi:MAG TPA: hypothetical protein VK803_11790 [Steroidobacteraceae bacterium]|jgi:integrase|nr:hypothetical protein [Steroidobacteraceae bacterium]
MPFELPPGCTVKNGRYYVIRRNKWTGLTRVSDGEIAFWRAYYRVTCSDPNSMAGVLLAYLEHGAGELTEGTRRKYEQAIVKRLIPYCGHMVPEDLTSSHVAQYLEERKAAGAAIGANRERAALSSACNYAMRKGWMQSNPCHGVRRNRERPARRYVEHQELTAGIDRAPQALQDLLAAAYLTGARQTELMHMRLDQVHGDELVIEERKTGKTRTLEISRTLRFFLGRAAARAKAAGSERLFVGQSGRPWSVWGLQSAMRRLQSGFRFRDLRAKAASDASHNVLGHAQGMLSRYKRRDRLKPVK